MPLFLLGVCPVRIFFWGEITNEGLEHLLDFSIFCGLKRNWMWPSMIIATTWIYLNTVAPFALCSLFYHASCPRFFWSNSSQLFGIRKKTTNQESITLIAGWTNPFEKYAQVKLDHCIPRDRDENNKYLKPPSNSHQWRLLWAACRHPATSWEIRRSLLDPLAVTSCSLKNTGKPL